MAIIKESDLLKTGADTLVSKVQKLFSDDESNAASNYLGGSVSNFTKDLIMTFPMLTDDSISPQTAGMISKANERNIATMLKMLFTSLNIQATSGSEAISKVHTNINFNKDVFDVINQIDNFVAKNGNGAKHESVEKIYDGGFKRESDAIAAVYEQASKPDKVFPVDSLNEHSLNDYLVCNLNGKTLITEAKRKDKDKDKEEEITTSITVDERPIAKLLDNDVKKANELQPTLMEVNYYEKKDKNDPGKIRSFIAGVKSRIIRVESNDIVDRLVSKNRTKINFLNFIRATTGEIKFGRDFLFAIDQAKLDAKNAVKKGPAAEMWNLLSSKSAKNNKSKTFKSKRTNDASAITVLAISQETVNTMKKYYKFDLEIMSNARMILDTYNLMGIIIADDSIEVLKSLYTGNDSFEETSYAYATKEADDSYKKIVNLIGQTNAR